MHRHGVRCLEFSGVKAPLLRQYSVAAGATRSAAATATRKFRRRPVEVPAGIEDLSEFTTQLVRNTVRGDRPGWKRTLVDGGEQLEALVSTPTDRRTPSAEQKIFSASAAEFVGDDSIAMSAESLPVGTFVEIRRYILLNLLQTCAHSRAQELHHHTWRDIPPSGRHQATCDPQYDQHWRAMGARRWGRDVRCAGLCGRKHHCSLRN